MTEISSHDLNLLRLQGFPLSGFNIARARATTQFKMLLLIARCQSIITNRCAVTLRT